MPNWCSNSLVLRHDNPEMIVRAYKAFTRGEFCNEFKPVPQELRDVSSPNRGDNADQLIEKYGYADWYSFCVNEWGTKWDFGDDNGINEVTDDSLTVYFDSAWAPPIAMMAILEDLGFEVNLMYCESGMGFCGQYSEGFDDFYEYGGMSADEMDEQLPPELNEAFCISENQRMWEEENAEENEDES